MSSATSDDTLYAGPYGPISPEDTSKSPSGMNQLRAILDLPPNLMTRWRELHDEMRATAGDYYLLIFLEAEVERLRRLGVDELTEEPRDDLPSVGDYLRRARRNGSADREGDK